MNDTQRLSPSAEPMMAAIDMGSNSFHMVIARLENGEVRPVQKLAEKVMLAAGLDDNNMLDEAAFARGLDCLRRFAQCIPAVDSRWVRCVGTNSLREARNGEAFLRQARQILRCPVEVVAGREEARLIYLGVAHTLADDGGKRLVFDIGGGSTEFIIGKRFEPLLTESLHMGCVSYRDRFFANGKISEQGFKKAVMTARTELAAIESSYRKKGWDNVVGASGSVKAIEGALQDNGWFKDAIDLPGLHKLRDRLLTFNSLDAIDIPGIKADRRHILPSGLAILIAIFEQLGIKTAHYSDGAMREGILYDLLGRHVHEDVRERSILAMMNRYSVDTAQAERVLQSALKAFNQVKKDWDLGEYCREWLRWSALSHEIGMAVSHSGFHKHGAYLLTHSDLPGFTRQDQKVMAVLVGNHRRKLKESDWQELPPHLQEKVKQLVLVLRLSVLFHRARREDLIPDFRMAVDGKSARLRFSAKWLEEHPLLQAELQEEQDVWKKIGMKLEF